MDSLHTIPMLTSREIRVLHLEPTDVCQASCPACAREVDFTFDSKSKHHLTLEQISQHINDVEIANLDKMFMCGVYGDPAAGRHTLDIYRYFRQINPEIVLGMNSNGAIQTTAWWQTLGEIFHRQKDYVVFSIDGLADTNHVYRRGVVWHKMIENALAYISTGASAHWDMLVYRHNEHQVDACEQLARDLGFAWFRAKVSRRALRQGLERPINWQRPSTQSKDINCQALKEKSTYIDARGNHWPCCWIGSTTSDVVVDIETLRTSWTSSTPNKICESTCGQTNLQTNFTSQWQRETELQ